MNAFQNMKIRTKLISGFLIVVILALILGIMSIYGLSTLSTNETELYEKRVQALYQAEEIEIALHQQRIAFRDMEIFIEDADLLATAEERLERYKGNFTTALEAYKTAIGEEDSYYTGLKASYENEYLPMLNEYVAAIGANDLDRADALLEEIPAKVDLVEEDVGAMVTASDEAAHATEMADTRLANTIMIIVTVIAVVAIAAGIALALYNARLIATPTQELVRAAHQITEGDLNVDIHINQKDEIGVLAASFQEMAAAFREQARVLAAIAGGDYTGSIAIRSDKDEVNRAIATMLDNNNAMIAEIRQAAEQVAAGSVQIADGAQSLATGSTEQAATLQEFSATINQLQVQADDNNKLAGQTLADTEEAGRLMGESLSYMDQMTTSMQSINESSQNIAKVIKVIDDIAFQTNILALNAAVEAARAGQHGKGFAVVADEVRNLASKSAAAAKETADLIEHSVQNVNEGTEIAAKTGESLAKVGEIAAGNATAMAQMSDASQQQSVSITEINQGIAQISSVVQANSATAEESAASAEELSAQSTLLNKTVERFKLRASASAAPAMAARPAYEAPALPQSASGDDYLF